MALWLLGPDPAGNCCDCTGRTGPCDTCGEVTVCDCSFKISNYFVLSLQHTAVLHPCSTYSSAQVLLNTMVADCLAVFRSTLNEVGTYPIVSKSASYDATLNKATISISVGDYNSSFGWINDCYILGNAQIGSKITVNYNCQSTGSSTYISTIILTVRDCSNSTTIEQITLTPLDFGYQSSQVGTISMSVLLPITNEYLIHIIAVARPMSITDSVSNLNSTFVVASTDNVFTVNPVIALYDDSGTTRQLEACPKMLLPPLTESSGSWYASCAAAANDIVAHAIGCAIYVTNLLSDYDSISVSASNGSYSASETSSDDGPETVVSYHSVNLNTSATVDFAWSYTSSGTSGRYSAATVSLSVYDDTGTLVWSDSSTFAPDSQSDTFSSSSLSPGRYAARIEITAHYSSADDPETCGLSATFSPSSGSITGPNSIQALYDTGLSCPSRLDCGDSC